MRMTRFTRIPALVLLAALLAAACERTPAPAAAAPGGDVVAAVRQLEDSLRRGMVSADTAVLAGLWAPEYLSTSAVGHTSSRVEALAAYGAGLVKVDSAALRDVDVRAYGSTAVALGLLDWAGSAAGLPFSSTVRFQHVWVFNDGAWRLVASQLTNQPGGAPGPSGRR